VVGFPLALLLRRPTEGWIAAVADSLLYGFVLLTMAVTIFTWLDWVGVVISVAVWIALVVFAVRRRALPTRGAARGRLLVAAWILLFAVAIALRLHSVNFLPWVGDMGAYINWANGWQVTGDFVSAWPPLTAVFLSMSSFLFGTAQTASIMPVTGILLLIAVARLLQRLGIGPWVVYATTALMAFEQHAVWYSSFPSSESLNLPLFLTWAMVLLGILTDERSRLPFLLGMFGLSTLALCLLRGSGSLLVIPVLAIVVLAFFIPAWRHLTGRLVLGLAAAATGAAVGFWYGITVIPHYFVTMQFKDILPGPIFDLVVKLGLTTTTPQLVVLLIALPAGLAWAGWRIERRELVAVEAPSRLLRGIQLGVIIALLLGVIAGAVIGATAWFILLRMGPLLIIGAAAVFLWPVFRRLSASQQVLTSMLMATVLMFVALHTYRLRIGLEHAFYLYWDRYLVSEYLPAATILTGVAVAALVPLVVPFIVRKRLVIVASVAAALVIIVPSLPSLALQSQNTYMDGAYAFETELIDLGDGQIGPEGATPIVWSATSEAQADGWFFPNTWMGFAVPLKRSFGIDVLNASQRRDNFAHDEVLTIESLENYARCSPTDELVVYETQLGGPSVDERLAGQGATFTPLGEATSDISLLAQPADAGWTQAAITVKAWTVRVAEPAPGACEALRD
jgi:hypothetical protein